MKKIIIGVLILITVSCTKQTDQEVGFFHGLNWQSVVILIVIFILIFQLPKFIWIAQQRKNKNQIPQQLTGLMSSINFTTIGGWFKSLFANIGKIFSIKMFRLPFILIALLLSLIVINYIDHSDSKKTNNPEEQSYIPEKGFIGNLWEVLFGKLKTKDDQNTEQQTSGYNPQSTNPNVVVRQTEQTKRDILYYDNLEKKWLHDEKMKKMEVEKEAENNKPIQMVPLNSINTPQHTDNGWGNHNITPDQGIQMQQLDGFKLPQ